VALCQLLTGTDKTANLKIATDAIKVRKGNHMVMRSGAQREERETRGGGGRKVMVNVVYCGSMILRI
jgi:hypothetical protein